MLAGAAAPASTGWELPCTPAPGAGPPRFVLGVWYQPGASFTKWKKRGINTIVGRDMEGGKTPRENWLKQLDQAGLYSIRQPEGDPIADGKDPRLLAWFVIRDEPDVAYRDGDAGTAPADALRERDRLRNASPSTPLFINVSGSYVIDAFRGASRPSVDDYRAYLESADWISNDHYPVTSWARPDWIDLRLPIAERREESNRFTIGWVLTRLSEWSGGKPQFAILETSNQNLTWVPPRKRRGVSPDELRGQIWHAIINGARGLIYFPCSFNEFQYDGTPPDVAAELITQNARITAWADLLLSPGQAIAAPAPFEAATRSYQGHTYRIVLNFSHEPSTYVNGDRYGAYEYRAYLGD